MAKTGLNDGMGGEEIITGSGIGMATQSPFFTGSVTVASQISGANIFSTGSVVGAKASFNNMQAGYFVTSAGSLVNIVFPTAFAAVPKVVLTGFTGTTDAMWVNAVSTGSVQIYSITASKSGAYFAIA